MDFAEVQRTAEAVMTNATELYRKDVRIRAMIDSAVHAARGEFGRYIDPERADKEALDLALRACAILASRIYTEDAEINSLRWERDRYKQLAEQSLRLAPSPPLVFVNETGTKGRNSDGNSDNRIGGIS